MGSDPRIARSIRMAVSCHSVLLPSLLAAGLATQLTARLAAILHVRLLSYCAAVNSTAKMSGFLLKPIRMHGFLLKSPKSTI